MPAHTTTALLGLAGLSVAGLTVAVLLTGGPAHAPTAPVPTGTTAPAPTSTIAPLAAAPVRVGETAYTVTGSRGAHGRLCLSVARGGLALGTVCGLPESGTLGQALAPLRTGRGTVLYVGMAPADPFVVAPARGPVAVPVRVPLPAGLQARQDAFVAEAPAGARGAGTLARP